MSAFGAKVREWYASVRMPRGATYSGVSEAAVEAMVESLDLPADGDARALVRDALRLGFLAGWSAREDFGAAVVLERLSELAQRAAQAARQ